MGKEKKPKERKGKRGKSLEGWELKIQTRLDRLTDAYNADLRTMESMKKQMEDMGKIQLQRHGAMETLKELLGHK